MRYLALTGEPFDLLGIMAAQFLCGGVLLLPYLFLSGDLGGSDWGSAELWWSIAFIVIGAQVLAFLTFYIALMRWPGSRVYPWAFLAPVIAIVIEAFRGNLPGAWSTAGMAVVVAGHRDRQPARGGGEAGRAGARSGRALNGGMSRQMTVSARIR